MLEALTTHVEEVAAILLFGIGFTNLLLSRNMIKKIIGFAMLDSAIYLFLASYGYVTGRVAPVIVNGITQTSYYVNPLPAGLVLTGIVVSVSVSAIMLALTVRLYRKYHTLDIDEIATRARRDEEEAD